MKICFSLLLPAFAIATADTRRKLQSLTATEFPQDFENGLDVGRDAMKLDFPDQHRRARKSGYTYLDVYRTESTSSVAAGGMTIDTSQEMQIENEMKVKDLVGGGQEYSIHTTRMMVGMKTFGVDLHCDSDRPNNAPECTELLDMVGGGATLTLVVDDDGNIVEASGNGADVAQKFSSAMQGKDKDSDHLKEQLLSMARVLQFIPNQAVKAGDTWQTMVDMGDIGSVDGVSKLNGYKDFEGSDVAVIFMNGKLHMNMEQLLQTMGIPSNMLASTNIEADITQAIFWDYEEDLALWSQANTSMILKMKDPMGGSSTMDVPSTSTAYIMTSIKDRPVSNSDEAEPTQKPDVTAQKPDVTAPAVEAGSVVGAVAKSSSANTNAVDGAPQTSAAPVLVTALLVAVLAVAALAISKHGTNNWKSKPKAKEYEFTSVMGEMS